MATVTSSTKSALFSHGKASSSQKPSPTRKNRRLWILCLVLAGVILFVWLLPTLVAHSFLLHWVIGYMAADFQGQIRVGGASLGWFSPIQLQQIEVQDTHQDPLAVIARATGNRALWKLLWNPQNLGRFTLEEPNLRVLLRTDGSNWEDALAHYLSSSEPSTMSVKMEVEVKNGTVSLTDTRSDRSWRLEHLQATLVVPPTPCEPWQLVCTGQSVDLRSKAEETRPEVSGQFQWNFTWGGGSDPAQSQASPEESSSGGKFTIQGEQIPLGLAEAILMRWVPALHLAGRGTGWLEYQWGLWTGSVPTAQPDSAQGVGTSVGLSGEGVKTASTRSATVPGGGASDTAPAKALDAPSGSSADAVVIRGNISAEEATLAWSEFLSEEIALQQCQLQGGVIWTNEYIHLEDLQIQCEAGHLTATGRLDLRSAAKADWSEALRHHPYQVQAQMDLAQWARLLPQTLRIQEGTQVTSGQVELAFSAQPGPEGMVWQGWIYTHDLKALHQGRPIAWPEPIRLTLDAHESSDGPVLQSLQCTSDFLRIDGFGSWKGLSVSAQMDLDQLTSRLRDWVDLGDLQLAGKGAVSLSCNRPDKDRFEADLIVQGDRLQIVIPQWSIRINEDIRARAKMDGKISTISPLSNQSATVSTTRGAHTTGLSTPGSSQNVSLSRFTLSQIDSALVVFQLGQDQGEIRLCKPVQNPGLKTRWPVELHLEGQLADWVPRLKPWVDIQSWQPTGKYALSVSADASNESVQVHQARLSVAPFSMTALGLQVSEPRMDMAASAQWDLTSGRIALPQATLQADRFLLEAQNLLLESSVSATAQSAGDSQSGMKLAGQLRAQGTLEQLQRWLSSGGPSSWSMSGTFTAQAELQTDRSRTAGTGILSIRNLMYQASAGSTPWKQAEVRLTAQGAYDHQSGLVQLVSTGLQGDGISYAGSAQITPPAQPGAANAAYVYQAAGQLQYDWYKLTPLLQTYWGTGIVLQGRGAQEFRWQGPLDFSLAQASFGVGWQALDVYGFRGGPALLRGTLSGGRLQIAPVEMDLSEGKLQAAAAVHLSPSPMELVLQKGASAQQIRVSRPMCASALQYVAPVLAEVTSVEGRVSLLLDACRVPLTNPAASQIQGRLVIHSIQIGPGPLIQELASLLTHEPTARLKREAVIPFTMAQGRIYHEGLELVFPEVTIRTRGSVGLDKSLSLIAEMPVPPKWTAQTPRLATALKGQTIQLPIQGTLQQPRLDQQTMRRYTGQLLQKSAENLLQDELQRQLDRLKKPHSP